MFTITIDDAEVKRILKGMDGSELLSALEDAGQIIIESTKAGYLRGKGPDGSIWPENPSWYKEMKRGAATLTGPTSKTIGGALANRYEFANVNLARMKNSLVKNVDTQGKKVTVEYNAEAEARAQLTQLGGEGKIMLNSISGKGTLELSVNVQARKHLGVADSWERLGFKNDIQHILSIFEQKIDNHFS